MNICDYMIAATRQQPKTAEQRNMETKAREIITKVLRVETTAKDPSKIIVYSYGIDEMQIDTLRKNFGNIFMSASGDEIRTELYPKSSQPKEETTRMSENFHLMLRDGKKLVTQNISYIRNGWNRGETL